MSLRGTATGRPLVTHDGITYVATSDPDLLYVVAPDGTAETSELPGRVAPIAAQGSVVVLSSSGTTVAVDHGTTETLWSISYGVPPGYEGRLAYRQGVLYLVDAGTLAAVSVDTGIVLWTNDELGIRSEVGGICVTRDVVCVTVDDRVIAVDAAEGTQLWEVSTGFELADTSVADQQLGEPTAGDDTFIVTGAEQGMVGVQASDGRVEWNTGASAASGAVTDIFTFVQTRRTLVAWSGPSEFWRVQLAGQTLSTDPVSTGHHVIAASLVDADRHEHAHDTVLEAFTIEGGQTAGAITVGGSIGRGIAPGPGFAVAPFSLAQSVKDVPSDQLVAFR